MERNGVRDGDVAADIADRLEAALSRATGQPAEVRELQPLRGGASREIWAFTAVGADGPRRLVLRRDPPGEAGGATQLGEAEAMRAAARAGVAVPGVVAVWADAEVLGTPAIVMDRIEGEAVPPRVQRSRELTVARTRFAGQCGQLLGRLHSAAVEPLRALDVRDPLASCRAVLDRIDEPRPALEYALRRLEQTRPDAAAQALVHGDFRLGNLLVGPEGITAVLDWELAHVGDPREDLGYLCARSWRFGGSAPVGGIGSREDLLAAYEDASGVRVSVQELRWWEAYGALRWGVLSALQARRHLSGDVRSLELAAIARRTCEPEWDALLGVVGG